MNQNILNKHRLVQLIVHRLSLTNAKTLIREKTVPVYTLSSRGINKFHLEGDCHLESDIKAIKVYQCLSKLSRGFASYESSTGPHEYNLNNIRDMKNSEATHAELSKDSVTDYVTKTDEKSVPISCDRAQGLRQFANANMLPVTENLPEFLTTKRRACFIKAR